MDLRLSVWFDKTAYFAHELITAHAGITNAGTALATDVRISSTGNLSSVYWAPVPPIAPGQTVENSVTGYVTTESGPLVLTVTVGSPGGPPDANPADNTVTASVPVTYLRGSYRGTVYGDRNGNHAMDPDEALAGIRVDIFRGNPLVQRAAVTDAGGHFAFPDLPAGGYATSFADTDWYLPLSSVQVTGVDDPDVLIRGTPSVALWLSTSAAFTRESYRVNDIARLTLTLTDKGPMPLTDLTAECWATASGQVDTGKLAVGGPGVTVPAGSSRMFELTVRITEQAAEEGNMRVWCAVGAPPSVNGPVTSVGATARVPGGVAPEVVGYLGLFRYKPQLGLPASDPLPGVKVYLREQVTGRVVTRAVTDAAGNFAFHQVPAGIYDVGVVGPWQLVYTDPEFLVRDGENGLDPYPYRQHRLFVIPGPDQPDPDAAPPPGSRPARAGTVVAKPRPGTAPAPPAGLATTGVEVTWLALGGLLTVVIGTGLVLLTRRRWP
ncbi:carboxypeptidase-like regulatory domain-containing protein [Amycolatopsis sp. Hca4]|uniref:carboxypeptidase-like regulatory domain-containing protein n=1 Tax=Amycolatopsis sp. Hca4 TaxID=2742131 RepID=UPI001590E5D6|nr:CARDB domain-containing protein [Amycolatopsis sp. Hca4]QKV80545.1 hypothetical protein HUT10_47275 [Amycolatopsis sp. Hca4]